MNRFITAEDVIGMAFSRKLNVNKIPDSFIETAQYKYIRPILGEDLYEAVEADPTSATYATLMTYIKPALAWWIKYLVLPEIYVEIADTGVKTITNQNAQNVSDQRLIEIRENSRIVAEDKIKQLTEYLEDSDLTDYYGGSNPDNTITVAGGIIFDDSKTWDSDDENDQWAP